MRKLLVLSCVLFIIALCYSEGYALQYLNRRLLQCEPLTYVVEPLDLTGKGMSIGRGYSNEYGDCTGLAPGPPFIVEKSITVANTYNEDGTVCDYGSFTINNSYTKENGEEYENKSAFEVVFGGSNPVNVHALYNLNGYLTCKGKAGDPIIFTGCYRIVASSHTPRQDFANNFSYCTFLGREGYCASNAETVDIGGGHTTFHNCIFKNMGPKDSKCISYQGTGELSIKDCLFKTCAFGVSAPVVIYNWGGVELENLHFSDIIVTQPGYDPGLIDFAGGPVTNSIKNITYSNCSSPYLQFGDLEIYDSVYIQLETPMLIGGLITIDSGGTLVIDKGTTVQLFDLDHVDGTIKCKDGKLIVDSAVITGWNDREYGYKKSDAGYNSPRWDGIAVFDSGSVDIKNSRIRLTYSPIEAWGDVRVDSTIFEHHIGWAMDITGQNGHEHYIKNSFINGGGNGSGLFYQTSSDDTAPQRFTVTNTDVMHCSSHAIDVNDYINSSKPFDLFVEDCNLSACEGGLTIELMAEIDTVSIKNCYIGASEKTAIYFRDMNGDSANIHIEGNMMAGAQYDGSLSSYSIYIPTGKADFINNSVLYCKGPGCGNGSRVDYMEKVYNNIFAHNGSYGYKQTYEYGDHLVGYNNFYDNDIDGDQDVSIKTPIGTFYTFEELIALGGVAATNMNYNPGLIPADTGMIEFIRYDADNDVSAISVRDLKLDGRSYADCLIRPDIDDTVWYYIRDNTDDSLYIYGHVSDVAMISDTFMIFDPHLSFTSPLCDSGFNDVVTVERDFEGDSRVCDADSNGTATVDIGADEYQIDSTGSNAGILVFSPPKDSLYHPGDSVDITWLAQDVNYVHIFYAVDYSEYATSDWQEIELGFDPDSGHCHWVVPDTISYSCRVLVQDALNSTVYGESGIFHIKPMFLTRLRADSTYERFRITEDNWQFENSEANMWPPSWYNQCNYAIHNDIYTGEQYPLDFTDPPVRAFAFEFPNWPLFVGTFGTSQCYMNVGGKMLYRQRALEYWNSIKEEWGGSCYGLSNSAMMAFGDSGVFKAQFPAVGAFTDLYPVTMTDDRRTTINRFMTAQFGEDELEYMDSHCTTPLKTVVEDCIELFGDSKYLGDLGSITICDMDHPVQAERGCHTMVPYKLESHMSDPDKFWIYVYDCNIPTDSTTRILVDTSLNYWTYDSLNWDSYLDIWVEQPLSSFLSRPVIPGIDGDDSKTASPNFYMFFSKADSLEVLSPDYGRYSVMADSADDSLTAGRPLVVKGISGRLPYGLYLPNGEWNIQLTDPDSGLARVTFMADNGFMTYYRTDVAADESDRLHYPGDDSTLWVMNDGAGTRSYGVRMCYDDDGGEFMMKCRDIDVSAGDSTRFGFSRQFGFVIENYGVAADYLLELSKLTPDCFLEFADSSAHIDSNTAHFIFPSWGEDYMNELTIFVDFGIDGSIDDTAIIINDILLDVDDEQNGQLPESFELGQNHPNPFNPATSIDYALPTRSQVTIEIFNLLGRKVRTLVDEVKPAGRHSVEWDGIDQNGAAAASGIYLYRIQAGDFVETKKMSLIK